MIRSLFLNKGALEKGAVRPEGVPDQSVKKLGVLGAGMMGQGIAYASAMAGIEVVLKDVSQDSADQGKAYSEALLANLAGNLCEGTGSNVFVGLDGRLVTMGFESAEPRGYLSVCQTPDGLVQLISSRQHYAFNLAWVKTPPPAAEPPEPPRAEAR